MKKEITVRELCQELKKRVGEAKTIDCCKEEIVNLANLASEKMGHEKIMVDWVDKDKKI
ncbi:MAG: hypothetical protein OEV66_09475 [Spirochaetia bacterium]|nr:hypothetical protein [Spirochaetia bacterium]